MSTSMTTVSAETLMFYIEKSMEIRSNLLITGSYGIGKSQIVEATADRMGVDCIVLQPSISDPVDFKGIPFVSKGSADYILDSHMEKLMTATEPTICFLDDLGQACGAVQAACMQIIEARCINGKRISGHVHFVAATNRREDGSGVGGLFEALKTRFAPIVHFSPDALSWSEWAIDNDMPLELILFIRFRPELLNMPKPSKEIKNTPCPRTIAQVGKWMNAGVKDAAIYAGCCGDSWATEFMAFLAIWQKLPNINDIISDPKNAPVPDLSEISVLYALTGMLCRTIDKDNIDTLYEYIIRMPQEFVTVIMMYIRTKKPKLKNTKKVNGWFIKNFNLL